MRILRGKLVRQQCKFRDRFLNNRLYGTVHVDAVVVHAIN